MEDEIKELRKLKRNEVFKKTFEKLCLDLELNFEEKEYILKCALLFFKKYDSDKRFTSYFKIGYYITLKYSLRYNSYQPLYDISNQLGFYPIIDFILDQNKQLFTANSKNKIVDALTYVLVKNNYKSNYGYIESLEQNSSRKKIINHLQNEIVYVAPTSYGKSSLIKDYIKSNNPNKVAVIVPTKSLLIQTYLDLKELSNEYKLVLHDEMYNGENKFIGILTQERATRILNSRQNNFYDTLFIDEAHNIFKRDSRSYILARLIQLNFKRNNNQKVIYLSPLIDLGSNLKLNKSSKNEISTRKVNYDFKSFEIYYFKNGKSSFIDRFSGEIYDINSNIDYFEYIKKNSNSKNFIYQNKPEMIEYFAENLFNNLDFLQNRNEEIDKIINVLSNEVHKDFKLINHLKKGIVYLHGLIPNTIKEYIESKYKQVDDIKYLVANKVVLEGINMPIETIFIANNRLGRKNISYNDLINLIGRANRLNFIFSDKNLNRLISKVHFLEHEIFQGKNTMESTIKKLNLEKVKDIIENPIVENYDIEKIDFKGKNSEERKEKQKIEDDNLNYYSDFILTQPKNEFEKIKRYCIENSISNIFKNLDLAVESIIENKQKFKFNENVKIVDIIDEIFIKNQQDNISDFEILRLNETKAKNYYNTFIYFTQHLNLNQRIISTKDYFEKKAKSDDPYLYIGTSFGKLTSKEAGKKSKHDEDQNKYQSKVYIDLTDKKSDLINLAIVKLKIEEDFVGYKLTQLISFLNDFNIISKEYYQNVVYGTVDESIINLVRFGLSVSTISELKKDNQIYNITLDRNGNLKAKNKNVFIKYLEKKPELFKFEIEKYLN